MKQVKSSAGTFTDNMKLPIHRWFRYSAGFSADWVKKELLDFWAKNTSEILKTFDVENAEEIAKSALKFDALLVPSANTSEEWAKYAELYHPISTDSFVSSFDNIFVDV